jgi:uncharacterized protein (TIGR02118 family)
MGFIRPQVLESTPHLSILFPQAQMNLQYLTPSKVLKFGDDAPFCVQATLEWGSMSDFQKAASSDSTKAVMDDVKNFSDKPPQLMTGEVVGSQ